MFGLANEVPTRVTLGGSSRMITLCSLCYSFDFKSFILSFNIVNFLVSMVPNKVWGRDLFNFMMYTISQQYCTVLPHG